MPIFRYSNKLIFFSHIPKCAGTSIESYCQKIGMKIAFLDNQNYLEYLASNKAWNSSSPQHIPGYAIARLFPLNFFDAYFTVVRNPINRLKSAFKFQKYI